MKPFEIIPAIDLWGGRLARMRAGDRAAIEELPGDPLDAAGGLVDAGAVWLHVVDLDAALGGAPANFDLLALIAQLPVRVQAGGSLTPGAAAEALARGAARAVLGSAVLSDPPALSSAVARHGGRVGVAIDVREGVVVPRGSSQVGPALAEALGVVALALPGFVTFTSTAADGRATGPDVRGLVSVTRSLTVPVFASGGVRSVEDVVALARIEPPLAGVIVGRSLQEGRFSLREAMDAARRGAHRTPRYSGPLPAAQRDRTTGWDS